MFMRPPLRSRSCCAPRTGLAYDVRVDPSTWTIVVAMAAVAALALRVVGSRWRARTTGPVCRVVAAHMVSGEMVEVLVEFTNRHPSLPLRLVSLKVERPAGARLQTGSGVCVFQELDLVLPGATHRRTHQIHRGVQGREWHDGEPFALEIGYRLGAKRVRRLRIKDYVGGGRR